MNSATIVEWPAGRLDLCHKSTHVTNILRKNAAAEHQAVATQLHGLVSDRSQQ
jgi:hypothetical protein